MAPVWASTCSGSSGASCSCRCSPAVAGVRARAPIAAATTSPPPGQAHSPADGERQTGAPSRSSEARDEPMIDQTAAEPPISQAAPARRGLTTQRNLAQEGEGDEPDNQRGRGRVRNRDSPDPFLNQESPTHLHSPRDAPDQLGATTTPTQAQVTRPGGVRLVPRSGPIHDVSISDSNSQDDEERYSKHTPRRRGEQEEEDDGIRTGEDGSLYLGYPSHTEEDPFDTHLHDPPTDEDNANRHPPHRRQDLRREDTIPRWGGGPIGAMPPRARLTPAAAPPPRGNTSTHSASSRDENAPPPARRQRQDVQTDIPPTPGNPFTDASKWRDHPLAQACHAVRLNSELTRRAVRTLIRDTMFFVEQRAGPPAPQSHYIHLDRWEEICGKKQIELTESDRQKAPALCARLDEQAARGRGTTHITFLQTPTPSTGAAPPHTPRPQRGHLTDPVR